MFILLIFLAFTAPMCITMKDTVYERAANFSIELMYFTAEETNWHTVISPLGVWSLLTGVSMATTEVGRSELRRALFLPRKSDLNVEEMYKKFMENVTLSASRKSMLKNKNFIVADGKLEIDPRYQNYSKNVFDSEVIKLSYNSSMEVADNANKIIKESSMTVHSVLNSQDFENSSMTLINVISFDGSWQSPFQEAKTREEHFYNEDGKAIGNVNMMQQESILKFSNLSKISASVLELPYSEDGDYSFIVILPYAHVKVRELYRFFEWASLKDILKKLEKDAEEHGNMTVAVSLPRFQISTNVVLNKPLQDMQVVQIFNPKKKTFGNISADNVYVSTIVHKAEINVTETGTAASAVSFLGERLSANIVTFKANRPFLYFIVKKTAATIIFSGAYSKPTVF